MTDSNPLSHIVQHPAVQRSFDAGPLTPEGKITLFSDHISMIVLAGFLLILILPRTLRKKSGQQGGLERLVPSGFGNAIEAVCHYLREEVARPALGPHTDRFIKYIWSIFFFVLALNVLGLVPIAPVTNLFHLAGRRRRPSHRWNGDRQHLGDRDSGHPHGVDDGRQRASDRARGFSQAPRAGAARAEAAHVRHRGDRHRRQGVSPWPIRLFANMVAGHTLMAVLLGFILSAFSVGIGMGVGIAIPVVLGSVAISMLEIFVAFLQAFIFTFLTSLFLGQSVNVHHDDHHEEAHA